MFAGIGGFRTGLTNAGDFFMPVGWCEKDKHAQKAYRLLYGSDSQLYKMAGNSVTTNVVTAIAQKLAWEINQLPNETEETT